MANVPYTNANAPKSRVNDMSEIPGQSRTVAPKTIEATPETASNRDIRVRALSISTSPFNPSLVNRPVGRDSPWRHRATSFLAFLSVPCLKPNTFLIELSTMNFSLSFDESIRPLGKTLSSALDNPLAARPDTEPSDRQARRRRQTRTRLVRAAAALFARQGVDNTRINEITDEADVGFGSFYNHFKSKEEIVEAVLSDTLAAQGATVAALTGGLEDPAEVVAVAHRHFVELARTDPDWAWLLIRLDLSQKLALGALGPFADKDIA